MGDLAKYFLALAVVGTGFYTAQQYRRPQRPSTSDAVASDRQIVEFSQTDVRGSPDNESASALPVAALADVDRVPLLGPDRAAAHGKSADKSANSVTRQPTLQADKSVADSVTAEAAKRSVAGIAERDIRKQAVADPSPKKPEKKKTATAGSAAVGQKKAGTDEKVRSETKAAETRDSTWQDFSPATAGTTEFTPNEDGVPPDFAREYQPYFKVAENGPDRTSASPKEPRTHKDNRSSQPSGQKTARQQPTPVAPRRHRIVEGDTLRRLAEEYLGSRDHYLDIFQANSDVLFDPRLIPIGVDIVIPDRTTVVAQAATRPTTATAVEKDEAPEYGDLWNDSVSIPGTDGN